ncbi:hypothetical protein CHY_0662 [Carboxydothermus hydrogenoformans Z-2901]|uniref:Uncharacterized protein n=1 Tax=Carboxydothermus hydrogenoformans (strain ATCC BAA-161 / DSM 6008 / Z-2901) TaxID=246194 RepID=Q3AEB7_CARHZ|nr:hypothetical protein CHY_0662 [Carboxydothermus hydrogenoformans Z-2901]
MELKFKGGVKVEEKVEYYFDFISFFGFFCLYSFEK